MNRTLISFAFVLAIAPATVARAGQDTPLPPQPPLVFDQAPAGPVGPPEAPVARRPSQQPQPQPQPPRNPNEPRTPNAAPPPPPPQAGPGILRQPRGKDINVQIELTITDQTGTAAPEKKTVSLMAADQTMGRVRAGAMARKENLGMVGTNLNVDARPTVLENDRVLLEMTIEYRPLRESQITQEPTNLNESISVILQNGKPLTVSQAADPITDRKMTVEVKATVLK